MTQQDIDYIAKFIRSAQGKEARMAFQNLGDHATAILAISFLSPDSKTAMQELIQSDAARNLKAALASREFADLNRKYGEQLTCQYLSKNRRADFEAARKAGECATD